MKKFIAKQTVASYSLIASFILALIGFIIYLVNSSTGYMAGKPMSGMVIGFTILAFVLIIVEFIFREKLTFFHNVINEIIIIGIGVSLVLATIFFALARVSLVADVHFIPVNYPKAEADSLNVGIVGVVFYFLAFVGSAIAGFYKNLFKEETSKLA